MICIKLAELLRRDSKKIISANFFHDISSAEIHKLLFTFYIQTAIENCVSMISQITGCTNTECTTTGCTTQGVQLQGVQLQGVQLQGVQLQGVQLQGVQLPGVQLQGIQYRVYKYRVYT